MSNEYKTGKSLKDIFTEVRKGKVDAAKAMNTEYKKKQDEKEKRLFLRHKREFQDEEDLDGLEKQIDAELAQLKAKRRVFKLRKEDVRDVVIIDLDDTICDEAPKNERITEFEIEAVTSAGQTISVSSSTVTGELKETLYTMLDK